MSLLSKLKGYIEKAHAYLETHWDHIIISIVVSSAITIASNVALHYSAEFLRLLHVSEKFLRFFYSSK